MAVERNSLQTATVDGAELAYEIVGTGPPLVLVHGLGSSHAIWDDVRPRLEGRFTVLAYDLRGSGATTGPVDGGFSLAQWARDLRGLLDALGWERPLLVGHSLGAGIALKYAREAPDRASGLVLIGADARLSRLAPRMEAAAELIGRVGLATWVDEHWSRNPPFSPASLERDPALLERYRALLLANDAGAYVRTCLAIAAAEDLTDGLAQLTLPALVVVGGADDRTLPGDGAAMARAIPDAELLEIDGVGHTLPFEAPEELAEAVLAFAQRIGHLEAGTDVTRVIRADAVPRTVMEGPFEHLDIRWLVSDETVGAELVAFGQTTYPKGATHELHYHPNAEEIVLVTHGRAEQIVGDVTLEMGPGDVCFIPRNAPHRITAVSEEDMVILWVFGGAGSLEAAGYVPVPEARELESDHGGKTHK